MNTDLPRTLTRDDLRRTVPSVFATRPYEAMSDRFKMVPTIEVLDILRDRGIFPVQAAQGRTRIPGKGGFTRHMIRLRHADHLRSTLQEVPELVLSNAHDGSAAYRFMAGIFRAICMNGLTAQSSDFGSISVRHSGGKDFADRVLDATYRVVEETPRIARQIETWKQVTLPRPQQVALATAAMEIRPNPSIRPVDLLTARRPEDATDSEARRDLWRTTNVIQESLVRGGIAGMNARGRRTRTRPIKAVDADLRTNRALWRLAEEMARLSN